MYETKNTKKKKKKFVKLKIKDKRIIKKKIKKKVKQKIKNKNIKFKELIYWKTVNITILKDVTRRETFCLRDVFIFYTLLIKDKNNNV